MIPWNYFVEEPGMVAGLEGCCLTKWHFFCVHSIPCGVSPTLILARDGAGSLAEAFWKICQKISQETHMPQRQEVMYLGGTGDKCRKLSMGLGWFASPLMNHRALGQLCVSHGQWVRRMAGALLEAVCAEQYCWEGKMKSMKEIEWVPDAFIFWRAPVLHNSEVKCLGRPIN